MLSHTALLWGEILVVLLLWALCAFCSFPVTMSFLDQGTEALRLSIRKPHWYCNECMMDLEGHWGAWCAIGGLG